jgi:thiamine biosynthesis lipoprotein
VSGSGLQKGPHIIDPRTGWPVKDKRAAWAFANSATVADALSTAFMIMTDQEIEQYCLSHPEVRALVILENRQAKKDKILHFGRWNEEELVD